MHEHANYSYNLNHSYSSNHSYNLNHSYNPNRKNKHKLNGSFSRQREREFEGKPGRRRGV